MPDKLKLIRAYRALRGSSMYLDECAELARNIAGTIALLYMPWDAHHDHTRYWAWIRRSII